ncbi:MAG: type IV pilus twitching motility protein PilT [Acidimicrobiales bacterium]
MPHVATSFIERCLTTLWNLGGTDLLFTAGAPPLARIDGAMQPLDAKIELEPKETEQIAEALLSPRQLEILTHDKEADFSFQWQDLARFRGNAFHTRGNIAVSLRLIPTAIPTFAELGLAPIIETFPRMPQGFVLVTGPTGSGKTTTIASVIDRINQTRPCHIVTLEDPIEYVHMRNQAAISQREIGSDSHSFPRALRSALREDPDVLLVGEMRDPESISTTLTIAETGHLVFATLHTNDAAQSLDRIVDVFPAESQAQVRIQLSSTLAAVVSQRLIPRVGGGRVAAFEVLIANHAVRNLIKEGKTRQIRNVILTGQRQGMMTLEMSLSDLVARGQITYEEAVAHSVYPDEIEQPRPVQPVAAAGKNGRLSR